MVYTVDELELDFVHYECQKKDSDKVDTLWISKKNEDYFLKQAKKYGAKVRKI